MDERSISTNTSNASQSIELNPLQNHTSTSTNTRTLESSYNIKMEDSIKSILNSRLFLSWQYELHALQQHDSDSDALTRYYPLYSFTLNIVTNQTLINASTIIILWNTCITIIAFTHCDLIDSTGGYSLSGLFFPIFFFILHISLFTSWKKRSNETSSAQGITATLNDILRYLKDCNQDITLPPFSKLSFTIFNTQENRLFYIFFGIILPACVTAFVIIFTTVSLTNGSPVCRIYTYGTVFYIIVFYAFLLPGMGSIFLLNTITIASTIGSALIESWINRYIALQRVRIVDLKVYRHERLSFNFHHALRRDAYERYLLINQCIKNLSKSFNSAITSILSVTSGLLAWYIYLAYLALPKSNFPTFGKLWIVIVIVGSCITMFSTLVQVTRCNASFDEMLVRFRYSQPSPTKSIELSDSINFNDIESKEVQIQSLLNRDDYNSTGDYEVIGGREEWLEFMSANPIYWTVFGFPFTRGYLQSLAVAVAVALAAAILPSITSLFV